MKLLTQLTLHCGIDQLWRPSNAALSSCLTSCVQELQPLGESLDQLAERDLSSPGPLSSHSGPMSSHPGPLSSHPGVSSQQGFNIQLDRELQDVQLEVTE